MTVGLPKIDYKEGGVLIDTSSLSRKLRRIMARAVSPSTATVSLGDVISKQYGKLSDCKFGTEGLVSESKCGDKLNLHVISYEMRLS